MRALEKFERSADYDALQAEMEAVAPNVAEMAWGHKYFAMLFPEILDDYHAAPYNGFICSRCF